MGHYKSSTPKRHYAYSNSTSILKIDKGVLQGWKRKGKKKVTTAVDASGRNRYKGTSKLRGTETLDFNLRHICGYIVLKGCSKILEMKLLSCISSIAHCGKYSDMYIIPTMPLIGNFNCLEIQPVRPMKRCSTASSVAQGISHAICPGVLRPCGRAQVERAGETSAARSRPSSFGNFSPWFRVGKP